MSLWRKEASSRLPELQQIIASREVESPMMLWIELDLKFKALCKEEVLQLDLLKRIWEYAKWCMALGNDDVATAAALGFCEHLLDEKAGLQILPKIMTRADYEGIKGLLLYHNSEADFADGLKLFDTPKLKHDASREKPRRKPASPE